MNKGYVYKIKQLKTSVTLTKVAIDKKSFPDIITKQLKT